MKKRFFSIITIISLLTVLWSCGDETELFPGGDRYKLEFVSLTDGDLLVRPNDSKSGTFVFFRISGDENNAASLTLVTDLYTGTGDLAAHNEKTGPSVNADSPIGLSSQLAGGQYVVELTLLKKDAFLVKERRTFFLAAREPVIQGILSYPLVIFPARPVLLIADMSETTGLNPYLKWTQGKKVIARGLLSEGYNQILWEAPVDDGVYAVTAEVYPFPPAGELEFPFAARASASAELFISAKDREASATLPVKPYRSLFDIYINSLREREKTRNGPTGSGVRAGFKLPRPVIIGESIGMKFDGRSGFACPEAVVPVRSKGLEPWTISLGVSLEGDNAGRTLWSIIAADASYSLSCELAKENEPVLRLKTKDGEYRFPSGVNRLAPGVRSLASITVTPAPGRWRVVWKLDGATISDTVTPLSFDASEAVGRTVIGGENGARCVIDSFDVTLR
jgi:hypothetical protein